MALEFCDSWRAMPTVPERAALAPQRLSADDIVDHLLNAKTHLFRTIEQVCECLAGFHRGQVEFGVQSSHCSSSNLCVEHCVILSCTETC